MALQEPTSRKALRLVRTTLVTWILYLKETQLLSEKEKKKYELL
jgi:hypothetical protein